MNKKTNGAWLIHHTDKLQKVTNQGNFQKLFLAGKCGVLLSALSETETQSQLQKSKVEVIAKASDIDTVFQLPTILDKLKEHKLIDADSSGNIAVLGITTATVLEHTNSIFDAEKPNKSEQASLAVAELISSTPKDKSIVSEYISDIYKMGRSEINDFLSQSEQIGFIDSEIIQESETMYFNGNIFRKGELQKVNNVLNSLSSVESQRLIEFNELLENKGCITISIGQKILGKTLFEKLHSIAFFDVNTVSNDSENAYFITKPSSFCKYGNPFTEDALDLAKAFVSSLAYGMNQSKSSRGKIMMLEALLKKMINGHWVGPATAIGQDYQLLEYKRVIETKPSKQKRGQFLMRLLKKDIGEIALKVLEQGNASEDILLNSSSVISYQKPETNREILRRNQAPQSKRDMINALRTLRTDI